MFVKQTIIAVSAIAFGLTVAQPSDARLVRLVVEQRTAFVGGASWGSAGPYELLRGTAFMEVDPRDPRNSLIVDLENAPRNARGMVEFTTQFAIAKPVDMQRSNHKIFHAVNNRGNNLEGLLTSTTQSQIAGTTAGYAFSQGYVVVDAGWEGDLVPAPTRLVANLPRASMPNGAAILGAMRYEYSDRANGSFTTNLEGTAGFLSYEASDLNTANATFTVADSPYGPKTLIPSNRWAFGTCPTGQASLVASSVDLCYFNGFDNTKIYELIYQAKNPIVMGLGFATTRDFASFLRYQAADDAGNPNPLGPGITRAYAAGGSQTGGYLRDYIYLGFNEDESARKVFDGIIPWIAGTDRVFINVRFADPNTYSEQDRQHNYLQTSYPPFTYAVTTDPLSGITDGILKRPQTDPLVMQVDSQSEFWQLHGSLNVVNGAGSPVSIPATPVYTMSGTPHTPLLRQLPGARHQARRHCVRYGTPASGITWYRCGPPCATWTRGRAGRRRSEQLSELAGRNASESKRRRRRLPADSNVSFPTVYDTYELLNFGPQFGSLGGILTIQPPLNGPSYTILVPEDGSGRNRFAGVHQIDSRVPVGTSNGWNVRTPAHRGPNLCVLTGSYFPFSTTTAERILTNDPRRSLEERYGDHAGFVKAVKFAAVDLINQRFLLPEDANQVAIAAFVSSVLR